MENWKRFLIESSMDAMIVVQNPRNLVMPEDQLKGKDMPNALITIRNYIMSAATKALEGSSIGVTQSSMTTHNDQGKYKGYGRNRMNRLKQIDKVLPKRRFQNPEVAIASSDNFEKVQKLPHYQVKSKLTKMQNVWFLSVFVIGEEGQDLVSKQIQNPEIISLVQNIKKELHPMFRQLPKRLSN